MTHTDTPGLSPVQFLYAVMLDRRLPMQLRINAADMLMQAGHGNASFVQAIKGRIELPRSKAKSPPPKSLPPMPVDYITRRLQSIRIATVNGMRVA